MYLNVPGHESPNFSAVTSTEHVLATPQLQLVQHGQPTYRPSTHQSASVPTEHVRVIVSSAAQRNWSDSRWIHPAGGDTTTDASSTELRARRQQSSEHNSQGHTDTYRQTRKRTPSSNTGHLPMTNAGTLSPLLCRHEHGKRKQTLDRKHAHWTTRIRQHNNSPGSKTMEGTAYYGYCVQPHRVSPSNSRLVPGSPSKRRRS